ncbi:hypothetical protein AGDE_05530 [Angomonas deanei]|uniref:EamA-like transporter family n=1 Tax=Angomonas deanei TaxID=59799 RepID=A0A7G2C8W5_9TRYP|nr:hypothetical protein AGDE_05530 [Angomonas deanei]CAD2216178.1 hypothetical protein, conserved [Angomonas deanei]|eukprot:EPY38399.1 hypothetical protein AGDE_05530 [Angomonas deanei]
MVTGGTTTAAMLVLQYLPFIEGDEATTSLYVSWILRVVSFVGNAMLTGQMWRYYIKALSLGPTPVCSIINTGTNFAVSAFMGLVLFGEEVNYTWACGALLVVIGLAIVVTDPHAVQ